MFYLCIMDYYIHHLSYFYCKMKKIGQMLGMICLLPAVSMAQITIVETDMAQVGDIINRNTDTLALVVPGNAGANQTWDLSNAVAHQTETTYAVAPSSTPFASGFSASNLALTTDNASYLYFTQNSSSLVADGIGGDLIGTGTPLVVPFNPSLLVQNFPLTYGSTFTDNYGMDVTTDGSAFGVSEIRYKRVAVVKDSTDGWGTVSTPDGTYSALRTKHIEYLTDSIWAKLFPFAPFQLFSSTNDTTVSYNWFAKESKLAVAELTVDSLGNPLQLTWFAPTVGIENGISAQIEAKIYPIPANNELNISLAENEKAGTYLFTIYSIEGKLLVNEKLNLQIGKAQTLDISKLSAGNYIWGLKNERDLQQSKGKLSVVR